MRGQKLTSTATIILALIWISTLFYFKMDLTPEGVVHENLTVCSKYKNKDLKSTYQVRQAQIHHVCGQISSSNQISYENYVSKRHLRKNWLYLEESNLVYCWTRKVASTSWNQIFHLLKFNKTVIGLTRSLRNNVSILTLYYSATDVH